MRFGPEVDVPLTWDDIASVELAKDVRVDEAPDITRDDEGAATYHQRISDMTNLLIRLEVPTQIRIPSGTETVSAITLYAADPRAFLDQVRQEAGRPAEPRA